MKNLFLLMCLLVAPVFADKIYIDPPNTSGDVDAGTIKELVRSSVSSLGHETVNNPADADYALRANVLRLGSAYIVQVDRISEGKTSHSAKLKASQVEELDEVVARAIRAAISEKSTKQDARVDDVSQHEVEEGSRRRETRSGGLVTAGIAFFRNMNDSDMSYYVGFGSGWSMSSFAFGWHLDLAMDLFSSSYNALFGTANIFGTYFFTDKDIAPFISGEFGVGVVRDGGSGSFSAGMLFGAVPGIAFFRTYSTHLELGVRLAMLTNTTFASPPGLIAIRALVSF